MVTMLEIQDGGKLMVLRERWRVLDRDLNQGAIRLSYEPKAGQPYAPSLRREFEICFNNDPIWKDVKDAGAVSILTIIDQEVVAYRAFLEAQSGENGEEGEPEPPPMPAALREVVEFLAEKEYNIIQVE